MKALINKYLFAIFGGLGATGAILFKYDMIPTESIDTLNAAGKNLTGVIVAFIGLLVSVIVLHLLKPFVPQTETKSPNEVEAKESGKESESTPLGAGPLLFLLGAVVVLGGLPSCSTTLNADGLTSVTTDPETAIGLMDRIINYFVLPVAEPAVPATIKPTGK